MKRKQPNVSRLAPEVRRRAFQLAYEADVDPRTAALFVLGERIKHASPRARLEAASARINPQPQDVNL